MLKIFNNVASKANILASASLSTTSPVFVKKIQETTEGNTTVVEVVAFETKEKRASIPSNGNTCSLCTCTVPIKVTYKDVLILEQFMREDGTVLPKELTGLCKKQQLRVERCVMQAHWSGLFPNKTIAEFDRAGYKRFNRYWNDDMDMYRLEEKKEIGTWHYIKRYNSKQNRSGA
uniref:28S ribosomal protein S18a, mitochondrial n=1 Tax=Rhabditophanes sp. KR3021 TaxID=114890 RepID=A0AC35TXU3_9BILA